MQTINKEDNSNLRSPARTTAIMLVSVVFLITCILFLAAFFMNHISSNEKFYPHTIKEKIQKNNDKISTLKNQIASLKSENSVLYKKNLQKKVSIKYIEKKAFVKYENLKKKKYKFYMIDGQVFVGRIKKVLKNSVIIYNYSTHKDFKAKKNQIIDVLFISGK